MSDITNDDNTVVDDALPVESQGVNPLELSDEEIMNMADGEYSMPEQDNSDTETSEEEPDGSTDDTDTDAETDNTDVESEDDTDGSDTDVETEDGTESDVESDTNDDETSIDDKSEVDYKADVEKLLSPFRANGKDIQVESVDDAIVLMKQGANYNKKMAALKPGLKALKMLENNGLLDEDKLSYLIDLDKKNPQAIAKLIGESGIDPLEVNTETDEYSPSDYSVSDNEMVLDEVLEKIQDTPTYQQTIQVVTKDWDVASKQELAKKPQLIEAINSHMQNGVYEKISNQVASERAMGRLTGLSDFAAYESVGAMLHSQGKLVPQPQADTTPPKKVDLDTAVDEREAERKRKKQEMKAPRGNKPAAPKKQELNPLAMSDEEFERLANSKYR